MKDPNEIRALKASFRGAIDTAAALAALEARIEALDEHAEIDAELLDAVRPVVSAHAVGSAALRGLVGAIEARRSTPAT